MQVVSVLAFYIAGAIGLWFVAMFITAVVDGYDWFRQWRRQQAIKKRRGYATTKLHNKSTRS